jgi:predicted Zn-dependent protease with MMP-like domain
MRALSVQALRERALDLVEDDPELALADAREAVRRQPDAESHYVLGVALSAYGDSDAACEAFAVAVADDPDHADAWVGFGWEHLDQLRVDDGRAAAAAALRLDPHHPDALLLRAALRERRGDFAGADRDLQAAALTSPATCPLPPHLDDDAITALVDAVLTELHPSLRSTLADVHMTVEEVPSDEVLLSFDPPMRPTELLGCMTGPTLAERSATDAWGALPASIQLFRRNIARHARDEDELRAELRVTLLHEIGHYLGLDEEDLAARGLD